MENDNPEELNALKTKLRELEEKLRKYENELNTIRKGKDFNRVISIITEIPIILKELIKLKISIHRREIFYTALKKKGLSVEDAAKSIEITADTFKKIINAEIPASINLLIEICKILDVPLTKLSRPK